MKEKELLRGITGDERQYWRLLIHDYGIDAVIAAVNYANEKAASRLSTNGTRTFTRSCGDKDLNDNEE